VEDGAVRKEEDETVNSIELPKVVVEWSLLSLLVLAGVTGAIADGARRVWDPDPASADAPVEAARVRIVDFGHDFTRFGDETGFDAIRAAIGTVDGESVQVGGTELEFDVEVDGNPETADCVVYDRFSLTEPLSPRMPWYDDEATSAHFYGGTELSFANTRRGRFTEHGVNPDHDSIWHEPRDNWALHMVHGRQESPWTGHAVWLWEKDEFLNGGASHRVSFDEQSGTALYFQRYWMGWEGCRWVVRDGEQFYVSEATFSGAGPHGGGKRHALCPAETRWALYRPSAPYEIAFKPDGAEFAPHRFDDVTAVGWYLFNDRADTQIAGCKWYAFEVDATVHRPVRPGETLNMVPVPAAENIPAFYMSNCEVPYGVWKTVFRWARSNTFVREPRGFIFHKDGDMGSMDFPTRDGLVSHSAGEPVTDLTLHDVAAWCNALSQRECRTPCYYEDPDFQTVFRYVQRSPAYVEKRPRPKLCVRWDADGYRLPTPAEWRRALAGQAPGPEAAWIAANSRQRTHTVGRLRANEFGLHDMLGNAWELCWTAGNAYDPEAPGDLTVLGGDFRYPEAPDGAAASPYGDRPYSGSYNIGFRVVRRQAGAQAPPVAGEHVTASAPVWNIAPEARTRPHRDPEPLESPVLEVADVPEGSFTRRGGIETVISPFRIGRREVTYAEWKRVYDWAVAHDYTFDHDGDMGSMDYWGPSVPHGPDEPVTDMSWQDCLVWCNALSEMEGRTPVYCVDEGKEQVRRSAFEFRPLMMQGYEADSAHDAGVINKFDAMCRAYVRWDADGYRLPTMCERDYAMNAGRPTAFHWGDDKTKAEKYGWILDNSDGTTHPVGQKEPNAFGLYDMVGNVSELCADGGYPEKDDVRNPKGIVGKWKRWTSGWREGGSFFEWKRERFGMANGRFRETGQTPGGWGYPDLGFRVVRCAAGTHPPDGVEPKQVKIQLDLPGDAQCDPLIGRVYRGSLLRTGCFDADGVAELHGVRWTFATGGPIKSSPVVVDDGVYVGSDDGHVYAVNAETGAEVWKVKTEGMVRGSAAVVDGSVYIGSNDGILHAIDAATGKVRWRKKVGDGRLCGSPAVAYGVVFIPPGNSGGIEEVRMSAGQTVGLAVATGEVVWRRFDGAGPQGFASPLIDGDVLYSDNCTSFGAWNLRTGKSIWDIVGAGQSKQFNTVALHDGVLYNTAPLAGSVAAMDLQEAMDAVGSGFRPQPTWQRYAYEKQKHLRYGGEPGHEVFTAPTVAHGRVYVGCNDGYLYTFDTRTGERGWKFEAPDGIRSSASVAGDVIYFGCDDGSLYALDAHTGEQLWRHATGGKIVPSPWPADGAVYVGSDDGILYALQ